MKDIEGVRKKTKKHTRPINAKRMARIVAIYVAATVLMLYVVGPFAWMTLASFKTDKELFSFPPTLLPRNFTTLNYYLIFLTEQAFDMLRRTGDRDPASYYPTSVRNVLPSMANSFVVGGSIAIINVCFGGIAAYAFARFRFRLKDKIFTTMFMGRVLPAIAIAIPYYLLIFRLGLFDSLLSLILVYSALTLPFSVFVLQGYIFGIPGEIDEAASIDGASPIQRFLRIMMPLMKPGLVAVIVISFMTAYNEFFFAYMLTQTPLSQTIPVIEASMGTQMFISWTLMNASGVVAAIPPICMLVIFRRYIISGLTAGSVKR